MNTSTNKRRKPGREPAIPDACTPAVQKIIDRLIGAARHWEARDTSEGNRMGADWAAEHAEIEDLQRLDAYVRRGGLEALAICQSPQSELIEVIRPGSICEGFGIHLCEMVEDLQDVRPSTAFFRGFAEGALRVWSEVQPHLAAQLQDLQETWTVKGGAA